MTSIGQPTPDRDPTNNISKIELPCHKLTKIIIAGETSGPPDAYTFTTSYEPADATPPITYLWDNGDATPDSRRVLDAGTHTLTVTATNCADALVTGTHTIVITSPPSCVETEMVELTLVSAAPIQIGSTAEFEADVKPDDADKPYTYRLTLDGTPGSAQTASDDPLTFTRTFATTGTHTVGIVVWNCAMAAGDAKSDTVDVEVVPYRIYLPIVMKDN